MYRKVQEAHLLLNALPSHVREAELEKARLRQEEEDERYRLLSTQNNLQNNKDEGMLTNVLDSSGDEDNNEHLLPERILEVD